VPRLSVAAPGWRNREQHERVLGELRPMLVTVELLPNQQALRTDELRLGRQDAAPQAERRRDYSLHVGKQDGRAPTSGRVPANSPRQL